MRTTRTRGRIILYHYNIRVCVYIFFYSNKINQTRWRKKIKKYNHWAKFLSITRPAACTISGKALSGGVLCVSGHSGRFQRPPKTNARTPNNDKSFFFLSFFDLRREFVCGYRIRPHSFLFFFSYSTAHSLDELENTTSPVYCSVVRENLS